MLINEVVVDKNVARITVLGLEDVPGVAFRLFNLLDKNNINVDFILQSVGSHGAKDISFTIGEVFLPIVLDILNSNISLLSARKIESDSEVAKISILGIGMMTNSDVEAKLFEAFLNVGVRIIFISISDTRINILIKRSDVCKATKALDDYFFISVD